MSENHRIKFRTGRDPSDSEARISAGTPEHQKEVDRHAKPRWDVDSLHRKMRYLTRGLETSDNTWQLHGFLADAYLVLDAIVKNCDSSETIREDTNKLHAVLRERRPRLLQESYPVTRVRLEVLTRGLERQVARYVRTNSAKTTQHASSRIMLTAPSENTETRTPSFGR
jgi:hypothetical protein